MEQIDSFDQPSYPNLYQPPKSPIWGTFKTVFLFKPPIWGGWGVGRSPLCINPLNPPSGGLLNPFFLFKPPIWGVGGLTFTLRVVGGWLPYIQLITFVAPHLGGWGVDLSLRGVGGLTLIGELRVAFPSRSL